MRELISGRLGDVVEATLVDDDELWIDGDRNAEVGLVGGLDVFCGRTVGGSMIIVNNGGDDDLYVRAFEIRRQ